MARDELRSAGAMGPEEAENHQGVIVRALRFLAGYGFFIGPSMERVMGRILDALAVAASCRPADMVGPHDHRKHSDASQYCRVGRLANALRRRGIHFREWSDPLVWDVLPPGSGLTPEACATAASVAWTRSQSDWRTECCIFQACPG